MPDKEFDNLFRDKFTDAEIEPSANFWANIEQQLEPKRKKVFPIYWMAAASVAVVLTSILVFQKDEKMQLRGEENLTQITTPKVEGNRVASTVQRIEVGESTAAAEAEQKRFIASLSKTSDVRATVKTPVQNTEKNISTTMQPMIADHHLPIKKQDPLTIDVTTVKADPAEQQVAFASNDNRKSEVETSGYEENTSDKKGIRNVGDLVNYVVEKIDKRDKKLIRFNTDDDDNSSIVGINIGFLKLNKKHK